MDFNVFEELLFRGIAFYGIELDKGGAASLYRYFNELQRWNRKVNLIAKDTGEQAIVENHFIDSLALLMVLEEKDEHVVDIGSGAGFPGLVCKLASPSMGMSLVEPRLKRVSFLRQVLRSCRVTDVTVQPIRLDQGVILENESLITSVVSRAVTDIPRFLNLCERFCVGGKRIILMKGPNFSSELAEVEERLKNWKLSDLHTYTLPFSGASRTLLSFVSANG